MNNLVKDYLLKRKQERDALLGANSGPGLGEAVASALSGIGATMQGKDAGQAASNVFKMQDEKRKSSLSDFDTQSDIGLKEIGLQRDEEKYLREKSLQAEDDDPMSEKSKQAQLIASKYSPGKDFSKLSYGKIKEILPSMEKLYSLNNEKKKYEMDRMDRLEDRQYKKEMLDQQREDRKLKYEEEAPLRAYKQLPEEKKQVIEGLAKKNASKIAISNQIDSVLSNWDDLDDDQKIMQGRQLIKVLNSTEGADAVGAEEAKRLGGKLEFAMGNLTNSNPMQFGRDLEGFKQQADLTSKAIKGAIKANNIAIDKAYGRATPETIGDQFDKPQYKVVNGIRYKKVPGGWEESDMEVSNIPLEDEE